mmetsp:Transcript_17447/g.25775  ORF Transcript_17447/g.25775 Transcript_17447/m.25775 type:complete len:272 (+) Transcript_17447:39-854(+)
MFKTKEEATKDYPLATASPSDGVKASDIAEKVRSAFPNCLTNTEFVSHVTTALKDYGYTDANTLLATSFCCDKVNRPLEKLFSNHYTRNFSMGGLAGFPFGGISSFKEMAHHVPDNGSCLIIYGPHVGIDKAGNISVTNPNGRSMKGACCESAISAFRHVEAVKEGTATCDIDPLDFQQSMVGKMLIPYADRLTKVPDPRIELPHCLYESQKDMIRQIVDAGIGEVFDTQSKVAIVGGIQINTAHDGLDFFLPLHFEVRASDNATIANLLM